MTTLLTTAILCVLCSCAEDTQPVNPLKQGASRGGGAPAVEEKKTEQQPAGGAQTPAAPPTPTTPTTPTTPQLVETSLADVDFVVVSNGFGPLEKNKSNGEDNADDGNPITIGGKVYQKGLGVHADSEITVPLNGIYKSFIAEVGVDDEVAENGTVVFQVIVDGVVAFDSGMMTGNDVAKKVEISVVGKMQMKLIVTNNGDDGAFDHADWADARLLK